MFVLLPRYLGMMPLSEAYVALVNDSFFPPSRCCVSQICSRHQRALEPPKKSGRKNLLCTFTFRFVSVHCSFLSVDIGSVIPVAYSNSCLFMLTRDIMLSRYRVITIMLYHDTMLSQYHDIML